MNCSEPQWHSEASVCRTAQRRDDKACMLVAKQLRGLLTVIEGKLQDAGLSATEKLWMQFSLTQAYMQLWQCYDGPGNSKKVFQVQILHMHALSWPKSVTFTVFCRPQLQALTHRVDSTFATSQHLLQ